MALVTTTTNALASISGVPGDMYFNIDTDQLVIFHTSGGTGPLYYKAFSNDGTLGASIGLTFNDNLMGSEVVYDTFGQGYYDVSAADVSGNYQRFDQHSEAITAILAETQMVATGGSISEIPGNSDTGFNYAPYLYQADGANSADPNGSAPSPRTNSQVFVFTGAVKGGPIVSNTTSWTDGISSGTYSYIPVIYLINDGQNSQGIASPMWGMTLVVAEGAAISVPYNSDPSSNGYEHGIIHWGGAGGVATGNNETTVRQGLTAASVTSNQSSNASGWTVDQVYLP